MTRALWAMFLTMAALVGIALAIALGVGAPHPGIIERAAAGAFGLIGLGAGSIALSTSVEAAVAVRRRPPGADEELADAGRAELLNLERSLRFGESSAGDFYAQVRPRLVRLTAARLAGKGLSLADRQAAVALLGADAYALVDPETGPPADRFQHGVQLERLADFVAKLEALGDLDDPRI